jgi:hypothetical protein
MFPVKEDKFSYTLLNNEVYFNKKTSQFYFKIVTETGFICKDITINELFFKPHILNGLNRSSFGFVNYIRGQIEERSNTGETSLYTFHGVCPFDSSIFIVKSLIDGSINRWDVYNAYNKQLYLNLDKPSIVRFIERYFIFKIQSDDSISEQSKLRLVK